MGFFFFPAEMSPPKKFGKCVIFLVIFLDVELPTHPGPVCIHLWGWTSSRVEAMNKKQLKSRSFFIDRRKKKKTGSDGWEKGERFPITPPHPSPLFPPSVGWWRVSLGSRIFFFVGDASTQSMKMLLEGHQIFANEIFGGGGQLYTEEEVLVGRSHDFLVALFGFVVFDDQISFEFDLLGGSRHNSGGPDLQSLLPMNYWMNFESTFTIENSSTAANRLAQ